MLETLKTVGAFVGLLTGIAYFYDRFAKGRPIASFTVGPHGTRQLARIRISNPSPYDIMVLDATVSPPVYFLTEDMEIRSIVAGASGRRPIFILKPGTEKELFLAPLFKDNVALETTPQRVRFCIWWRRGNATWLAQIPVCVHTDTQTIRKYALETGAYGHDGGSLLAVRDHARRPDTGAVRSNRPQLLARRREGVKVARRLSGPCHGFESRRMTAAVASWSARSPRAGRKAPELAGLFLCARRLNCKSPGYTARARPLKKTYWKDCRDAPPYPRKNSPTKANVRAVRSAWYSLDELLA